MFVKKFKKKCDVRGCKNITDVFVLSKRREMGNTIAMCRECMKDALASTESYVEPPKVVKELKPLFPHPELNVTLSSVTDEDIEPTEVIEESAEDNPIEVTEDTVADEVVEEAVEKAEASAPKPKATTNTKKKTNKKR